MKLNVNDLEIGECFVLSRERERRDRKPPFIMYGNGRLNKAGQSMDILDTMEKLTPAAIKLFKVMVRCRDNDTNEVRLKPSEMESPRLIQNHMPLLILNDVVIRLGNCHYMINPYLVVPNNFQSAKVMWVINRTERTLA